MEVNMWNVTDITMTRNGRNIKLLCTAVDPDSGYVQDEIELNLYTLDDDPTIDLEDALETKGEAIRRVARAAGLAMVDISCAAEPSDFWGVPRLDPYV